MKLGIAIILVMSLTACGVRSKSVVDTGATLYPPNNGNVCLLAGAPPPDVEFEIIGRIVATKRTYGGVHELMPRMAQEARVIGADAIINLQADQRFKGPLPWRITSPTGDGQAIKVLAGSPQIDCLVFGGKLMGPGGSAVASVEADSSIAPPAQKSSNSGSEVDLYSELLKLDELRQKGLLTEEEFGAEKKELLDKS